MADSKISELTALSTPADDDVFAIVDTDAGQTKKITAANVKSYAGSSTEAVQDIVGAMFSSNTETDITATYEDADGTIDLVVGVSAGNLPTAIDAAKIGDGSVSNTEFQRLDGVSSDIQTQLDGKQASLTFGISNTNVPQFTTGVADDDFLRIAGTSVEGRSASEVLSDIGGQASLTFGISDTNAVKVDSSSVADDEYARFTASGLESRSTAEVLSDIGGQAALTFGISNTNAVKVDSSSVADDEYARFTANGLESRSTSEVLSDIGGQASLTFGISDTNIPIFTSGVADDDFLRVAGTSIEGRSASEVLSDIGGQASLTFGISNTNAVKVDSASVADDEYARFTANGLESRSTAEVLSDIGGITASSTDTLTNKTIDADGTGNSITNIENANIKASAAIDATKIADGSVTSAEFQYLGSVTSDIQTQLDAKATAGLAVAMAIAL
tara:strand:+ start:11771 stop:13105 length:1335 start_codon:yes stop_codon:yes gene_type:complete